MLDFSDQELNQIRELLVQRYQKEIEIQLSEGEIKSDGSGDDITTCPTVFWHESNANFVILKIDSSRYKPHFFYTPHELHSTGIDEYASLESCVADILQSEQNHIRETLPQ